MHILHIPLYLFSWVWHIKLCHCSLQISTGTVISRSLQRCSEMGSRQASIWAIQGHLQKHSWIVMAVWLGSCWKVNLWPRLSSWTSWTRFSSRIFMYFALSSFPSTVSPSLDVEKQNCGQTVQSWFQWTRECHSESPWGSFSRLHTGSLEGPARRTIMFLVTSLTKALLPSLFPNNFPLRIMKDTVLFS